MSCNCGGETWNHPLYGIGVPTNVGGVEEEPEPEEDDPEASDLEG